MSLRLCVLGSGSTGNSIFVASDKSAVLIDLGLPYARVEKCLRTLGIDPDSVSVLLTHCHSDHISGLDAFTQRHPATAVYCEAGCAGSLYTRLGSSRTMLRSQSGDFFVGDLTVSPFKVSHDVPCVGYHILSGGRKVTVVTDVGTLDREQLDGFADSNLVVIECNHDEMLLRNSTVYPPHLKRRILSDKGHLSNAACAECVEYLAMRGVKQFVLAHLSKENNYPELAFETIMRRLSEGQEGVKLEVAPADRMSGLFEIS